MTLEHQFRSQVDAFLEDTRLSPTRFGTMALGDPSLVRRIDRGCSLTLRTADKDSGVHRRLRPGLGRCAGPAS